MSDENDGNRQKDGLPSVQLHTMPSANAADPIIVNTPHEQRVLIVCARAFTFVTAIVLVLIVSAMLLIESGVGDGPLASRAQILLQNAVGDRFSATVGGAGIRLAKGGRLALEARDVTLAQISDGRDVVQADAVIIALQVSALFSGELKISFIEIDGGFIDAGYLEKDPKQKRTGVPKVEDIDEAADRAFVAIRGLSATLRERETRQILLTNATVLGLGPPQPVAGGQAQKRSLKIVSAELTEGETSGFEVEAEVLFADQKMKLTGRAMPQPDAPDQMQFTAHLSGIHLGKMIREFTNNPRRKFRLESGARIDLVAQEGKAAGSASVALDVRLSAGELFMDGIAAQVEPSFIRLALDPSRNSLEFKPSKVTIGESTYSFNGGIIDLKNMPGQTEDGYAFDLLVDHATIAPIDSNEPPVKVAMKAFARYIRDDRRLFVDEFVVTGRAGAMFSSASVQFGETSPEVSFVANVDTMETTTVKQLWPYWIARKARTWVHENLYGGTVKDGEIRVFIPEGRMAKGLPDSMRLDENQLKVDFNIEDARFDVAGDIPPVRDAQGLLTLRGQHLELTIEKGSAFFPTGRSVEISDGTFVIDNTNAKPLMAHVNIAVAGDASAVAELVSYRPINALQQTPYKADDFKGAVKSKVDITFGLVQDQNPPEPDWNVELDLDGVSLGPKVEGVKVTDAKGKMFVDTKDITIDAEAKLNGMQSHLNFTDPLDRTTGIDPDRVVQVTVSEKDRAQFAPQLNEFIKGTVHLNVRLKPGGHQIIQADLSKARLVLPWIGWSKGKGIKATANFEIEPGKTNGGSDTGSGLPQDMLIKKVVLNGDGFSANGSLELKNGVLVNADITSASLSRNDKFAVKVVLKGKTYHVTVNGAAIDLRSSIKHLLSESDGNSSGASSKVELTASAGKAYGFNKEVLSDFKLKYTGQGSTILGLDLTAKTSRGVAIRSVGKHEGSGLVLTFDSGDAGTVARFADIYSKIDGGALNVQLVKAASGPYIGTVDIKNFDVVNDENLETLVSTKSQNGKSLKQAVRGDLDVSKAEFHHAFARVDMGKGYLRVSDGIARGPVVGFAFQGTVFDQQDDMNITGTFMPAYGLNRIFGEIPLLGVILGNGRDRGLIGITFRLTGGLADPKLEINPISIIAPGIFRSIFQFRSDDPNQGKSTKRRFNNNENR